jgi:hypothetical protein
MPVLRPGAMVLARRTERAAEAGEAGEAVEVPGPGLRGAWEARPRLMPQCSNPDCGSGRLHLWRRRTTPVFEGGWCCSAGCTRAQVEAALRREMGGRGAGVENHRHRVPLGLAMLEQGWITAAELRRALEAQRAAGSGRLGQWLVRSGAVSEAMVTRALGLQWGCPVLPLESHDAEMLTRLLPRLFLDAYGALPLRVAAGKILYLGFEDRLDPALALAAERMTGLRVESGVVEESRFRAAHGRMLESRFPVAELVEAVSETALARAFTQTIEKLRPVEARLVRVHDCAWLRLWLRPQRGAIPESNGVRDLIGSIETGSIGIGSIGRG